MFHVLIDTCVWLDLADKPQQTALLDPLEGLLSYAGVDVLIPQIVYDEFKRNKGRIAEKSTKGLSTHFSQVKDAVRAALDEASPRVREVSQAAVGTVKQAPLVSALAVGAVGYLLAWALHGSRSDNR